MAESINSIVNNEIHGRSESVKRASAVAAALELILAKVSNSATNPNQLDQEFESLSKYADQIQAALKAK